MGCLVALVIFLVGWPIFFIIISAILIALFGEGGGIMLISAILSFLSAGALADKVQQMEERRKRKSFPPIVRFGDAKKKNAISPPPFPTITGDDEDTPPSVITFPDQNAQPAHPIMERTGNYFSSPMDGTRISITYSDKVGDITRRTIKPLRLRYDQIGQTIFPTHIEAFCEMRQDERTFLVRSIQSARAGMTRISDLNAFLISHTDFPAPKKGPEKDTPNTPRAERKKVLLDDPRITIFCGYKNPKKRPTEYTMRLDSMMTAIRGDTITILTVSGWDTVKKTRRSFSYARIVDACDPDTGEIIEDLQVFLDKARF